MILGFSVSVLINVLQVTNKNLYRHSPALHLNFFLGHMRNVLSRSRDYIPSLVACERLFLLMHSQVLHVEL